MTAAFIVLVSGLVAAYSWSEQRRGGRAIGGLSLTGGSADSSGEKFYCDGRIYCSQMTPCAEAKYFLDHCPGTRMNGNNDGIPCEKQWCK